MSTYHSVFMTISDLECTTLFKVLLHDKHPDGVCQIYFKEPAEADMAVQMLNGRLFGKK